MMGHNTHTQQTTAAGNMHMEGVVHGMDGVRMDVEAQRRTYRDMYRDRVLSPPDTMEPPVAENFRAELLRAIERAERADDRAVCSVERVRFVWRPDAGGGTSSVSG